jgi:uncharacterized DUF497 family protein
VLEFDWHQGKAEANRLKHDVSFAYAIRMFLSEVVEWESPKAGEDRKVAIGRANGQVLAVVCVWRGNVRWIISARPAKRRERRIYEQRS